MAAVAFVAPLLLGLFPRVRLTAAVLEIVAGIVLGTSVLGWVEVDEPIAILALLGLAFLLFLAGLEIDFHRLRGRLSRLASLGFVASLVVALAVALTFRAAALVENALLVAVMLAATSLGLVVPVLADSRRAESDLGQLVIAAASIADFGPSSCCPCSSPARPEVPRPRLCSSAAWPSWPCWSAWSWPA